MEKESSNCETWQTISLKYLLNFGKKHCHKNPAGADYNCSRKAELSKLVSLSLNSLNLHTFFSQKK